MHEAQNIFIFHPSAFLMLKSGECNNNNKLLPILLKYSLKSQATCSIGRRMDGMQHIGTTAKAIEL